MRYMLFRLATFGPVFLVLTLVQAQPADERCVGELRGVVVSAQSGEALAGSKVIVERTGLPRFGLTALAGRAGEFRFAKLARGRYVLSAAKSGYTFRPFPEVAVDLECGETKNSPPVSLWKSAAIGGTVWGPGDIPLAGAEVHACQWRDMFGARECVSIAHSETDDRGIFRVYGLSAGDYMMVVLPPRFIARPGELQFRRALLYPNVEQWETAGRLSLAWGEEERVDLAWPDNNVFSARIRVRTPEGKPCEGCDVMIAPNESSYIGAQLETLYSIEGGQLVAHGLPVGSYNVLVRWIGDFGESYGVSELNVMEQRHAETNVQVKPSGSVGGTVIFEGAPNTLEALESNISLHPIQFPTFWPQRTGRVADRTGSFEVQDVPTGVYFITLDPLPEGGYLRELRQAGRRLPSPRLRTEGDMKGLEIVVAFDGGSLSGQVSMSREPEQCAVLLIAQAGASEYQRTRSVDCDPQGAFHLDAIAPGDYGLVAIPVDRKRELLDPMQTELFLARSRSTTIEPNSQITIKASLVR